MNSFSERTEMLLPEPARALGDLLGVPVPDLARGDPLPLLWHWVYLLDRPAQADLGPDGHPLRGTITAFPAPGRRRMWAGGRVRASGPLRCGELATKRSRVLSVQEKQGRSGPLTFIVVEHQIRQRDRVVLEEQQDIVYRTAVPPAVPPAGPPSATAGEGPAVPPADGEWAIEVSPTLLFRFSALTYNAHRIHYDRDYAIHVEGYPGLLTHGPLQALAMAEAARAAGYHGDQDDGRLHFDYRLTAPLFDDQDMMVSAAREQDALLTAVRGSYGPQTAAGTLRVEPGRRLREPVLLSAVHPAVLSRELQHGLPHLPDLLTGQRRGAGQQQLGQLLPEFGRGENVAHRLLVGCVPPAGHRRGECLHRRK
jgi:3-methylfumaryl-CoA hydratase